MNDSIGAVRVFWSFWVRFFGCEFSGEEDEKEGTGFKAGGGCRRGQYDAVASDVAVLIRMLPEVALTDGPWLRRAAIFGEFCYLGIALQNFFFDFVFELLTPITTRCSVTESLEEKNSNFF
jgi:hypothetical protein